MKFALLLVLAYLLGSTAWSVWLGRWLRGIDLREYGSGNAGATNAFRVLGPRIGLAVLLLDALKGFFAVSLILFWPEQELLRMALLGLAAVVGHLFPVWAQFRGGKGVATLLGVVIALHPQAALSALGVFLLVLVMSRMVSLSSMAAALSLPLWLMMYVEDLPLYFSLLSIGLALSIIITHRKNILRIFKGEEKRVNFKRT